MDRFRALIFTLDALLAAVVATVVGLWSMELFELGWLERFVALVASGGIWSRVAVVSLASALVLLNGIYFLLWLCTRRYRRWIESETRSGKMKVSVGALEDSLARAVQSVPSVASVKVRLGKGGLGSEAPVRLVAWCTVWEGSNVRQAEEEITQQLQARLGQIVEFSQEPQCEVRVQRFVERSGGTSAGRPELPRESYREIYSGPSYPYEGGA